MEENRYIRPAHVAILPSPGIGHVTPLLQLAKRLVAVHGVRVTLFLIATHSSAAQRDLVATCIISSSDPDRLLRVVELPPIEGVSELTPPGARAETQISILVRESLSHLRSALLSDKEEKATVLVVDLFGTDAFDVADELHMSKYIFFTSTAWLLAHLMDLPALDRSVIGEYVDLPEPVSVPGCNPIQVEDLVDPLLQRTNDGYFWFLHHAARFAMARGILVNTWRGLEPTPLAAMREEPALTGIPTPPVYPIGPLIKPAEMKPGLRCLAWLDAQPVGSVLYVSFGSGGTLSAAQTTELAWGLELSRHRFLWVARRPAAAAADDDEKKKEPNAAAAFFTAGDIGGGDDDMEYYLPEGFLDRTEGRGLVVASWAPQVQILSHPAVGGFLSHGGWNSTLESVVNGVPMIVWPLYAEQKMNASLLSEDLRVAVRVTRAVAEDAADEAVVRREEVERLVRLLMVEEEGKEMKRRVMELNRDAVSALEVGGSSYNALAEVVTEWKIVSHQLKKMKEEGEEEETRVDINGGNYHI